MSYQIMCTYQSISLLETSFTVIQINLCEKMIKTQYDRRRYSTHVDHGGTIGFPLPPSNDSRVVWGSFSNEVQNMTPTRTSPTYETTAQSFGEPRWKKFTIESPTLRVVKTCQNRDAMLEIPMKFHINPS